MNDTESNSSQSPKRPSRRGAAPVTPFDGLVSAIASITQESSESVRNVVALQPESARRSGVSEDECFKRILQYYGFKSEPKPAELIANGLIGADFAEPKDTLLEINKSHFIPISASSWQNMKLDIAEISDYIKGVWIRSDQQEQPIRTAHIKTTMRSYDGKPCFQFRNSDLLHRRSIGLVGYVFTMYRLGTLWRFDENGPFTLEVIRSTPLPNHEVPFITYRETVRCRMEFAKPEDRAEADSSSRSILGEQRVRAIESDTKRWLDAFKLEYDELPGSKFLICNRIHFNCMTGLSLDADRPQHRKLAFGFIGLARLLDRCRLIPPLPRPVDVR